jgi:predicted O-methyltransferase YrrM
MCHSNSSRPLIEDEHTYHFSVDWFTHSIPTWTHLLSDLRPDRLLEIGAYEGRSTCFLIEKCASDKPISFYCIDTWLGSSEHANADMDQIERRFDENTAIARERAKHPCDFRKLKGRSADELMRLGCAGHMETFDFVYIDGSHKAPDVLTDAVLSFQLLRIGGIMTFDDYLWHMEPVGMEDPLNAPKVSIDSFLNIFQRKMRVLSGFPLYQVSAVKTST